MGGGEADSPNARTDSHDEPQMSASSEKDSVRATRPLTYCPPGPPSLYLPPHTTTPGLLHLHCPLHSVPPSPPRASSPSSSSLCLPAFPCPIQFRPFSRISRLCPRLSARPPSRASIAYPHPCHLATALSFLPLPQCLAALSRESPQPLQRCLASPSAPITCSTPRDRSAAPPALPQPSRSHCETPRIQLH